MGTVADITITVGSVLLLIVAVVAFILAAFQVRLGKLTGALIPIGLAAFAGAFLVAHLG